ncbi:MAG: hypothetical protein ABIO39_12715 [Caulobacteraceae bacterium]
MISAQVRWRYRALWFAGVLGLLFGSVLLTGGHHSRPDPGAILTRIAAVILAIVWTIGWVRVIWRGSDEYRHEAQKFAWLWGGIIGLFASMPIYAFIGMGGLDLLGASLPPRGAFALGYLLPLMTQTVGFLVALVYWRGIRS